MLTLGVLRFYLETGLFYLTPFNLRPPLIFGRGWPKKSSFFLGGRKLKGTKFFQNPSITVKIKTKNVFYRGWPKIKGAELGEGGRKLEEPKIKGAEN